MHRRIRNKDKIEKREKTEQLKVFQKVKPNKQTELA